MKLVCLSSTAVKLVRLSSAVKLVRFRSATVKLTLATPCCLLALGCAHDMTLSTRQISVSASNRPAMFARDIESSRRVGLGSRFWPQARGIRANRAMTIDGMSCRTRSLVVSAAHVELFAENHVVIVPAGIGVVPPLRTHGAYVRSGRCVYPLRTLDPTGLVLLAPGRTRTLGELFDLWGQSLSHTVLAGFRAPPHGRVSVFIDGVLWATKPASAPLAPHSQVTVEVGSHVPPHAGYAFPSLAWAGS